MYPVTSLCAALLVVVYMALFLAVVRTRKVARIAIGEGVPPNKLLQKQIRVRQLAAHALALRL
jgi:uncharacterized membrane protein YecN with MAPEG domain